MQRMILLAVTVFITLTTVSQAEAKNPEAQEFRRVVVTLNDGTTVEGYVKNSWHADNALLKMKRENYSFTLVPTPDSKEATKYTAEEVRSIEYTEKPNPIRTVFAGNHALWHTQTSKAVTTPTGSSSAATWQTITPRSTGGKDGM